MSLVCGALLVASCASAPPRASADTAALDTLLSLIVERLAVAPDVARAKWNTKAPIEDLPRERQIVEDVGTRAAMLGIPREAAERFFQAQIDASKTVQRELFARYEAAGQPPFTEVADLNATIRPTLDRLTPEMLRALRDALPVLSQESGRAQLQARSRSIALPSSISRTALDAAVAPFIETGR